MQGRLSFTIAAVLGLVLVVQSSPLEKVRRDSNSQFSQGQRTQVIGPSGSITQELNQNEAGANSVPAVSVQGPAPRPATIVSASLPVPVPVPVVHETYEYQVVPSSVHYTVKRPVLKVASTKYENTCGTCGTVVSDVVAPAVLTASVPVPVSGSGGAGIGYVGDVSGGNVVGVGGDSGR